MLFLEEIQLLIKLSFLRYYLYSGFAFTHLINSKIALIIIQVAFLKLFYGLTAILDLCWFHCRNSGVAWFVDCSIGCFSRRMKLLSADFYKEFIYQKVLFGKAYLWDSSKLSFCFLGLNICSMHSTLVCHWFRPWYLEFIKISWLLKYSKTLLGMIFKSTLK